MPPETDDAIRACPEVWRYLETAGQEGWEPVSAVARFRALADSAPLIDRLIFSGKEEGWETWDTIYLKKVTG